MKNSADISKKANNYLKKQKRNKQNTNLKIMKIDRKLNNKIQKKLFNSHKKKKPKNGFIITVRKQPENLTKPELKQFIH